MGLYEYFDALRREHPHLIIDSSASGGRRIDFEMLSGEEIDHVLAERPHLGPRAPGSGTPFPRRLLPFTGYSRQDDVWVAWQCDRPDLGRGLVQAFRRSRAEQQTLELRLRNLNPAVSYSVTATWTPPIGPSR